MVAAHSFNTQGDLGKFIYILDEKQLHFKQDQLISYKSTI